MRELALFSGAGGGLLASRLLGWTTVGACEIEQYPRDVVLQRQRDGLLDKFPIWDDVCTFDGHPWRGHCDIITGGFPCQDVSAAGQGAGITGSRSGLWRQYARIIGEVRPRFVFAENSPLLRTRGLGVVVQDLTRMGYDVRWGVLGAWHVGANHRRNRMWVLAHSHRESVRLDEQREARRRVDVQDSGDAEPDVNGDIGGADYVANAEGQCSGTGLREDDSQQNRNQTADGSSTGGEEVADSDSLRLQGLRPDNGSEGREEEGRQVGLCDGEEPRRNPGAAWWGTEPNVGRVAHGVAKRVDRLKAIGNGQVPAVAATAFRILSEGWV